MFLRKFCSFVFFTAEKNCTKIPSHLKVFYFEVSRSPSPLDACATCIEPLSWAVFCLETVFQMFVSVLKVFHESCFKVVDPQAEKEDGEVLGFGDEISLVDDRGMVWNNKDGRLHGRLGPSLVGE